MLLADSAPVCWLPEVLLPPLHAPEALQLVAPVELQVTVAVLPATTLVGLTAIDTVGAGETVTAVLALSEPPGPVPVSANDVLLGNGPTLCDPLVDLLPDHPPLAEHDLASLDVQVS